VVTVNGRRRGYLWDYHCGLLLYVTNAMRSICSLCCQPVGELGKCWFVRAVWLCIGQKSDRWMYTVRRTWLPYWGVVASSVQCIQYRCSACTQRALLRAGVGKFRPCIGLPYPPLSNAEQWGPHSMQPPVQFSGQSLTWAML
jgi:hypothetical protein